jgi:hypothetical protein
MFLHKHHIVPKHAGGTDELSNLIELTIPEHAEAHRLLWRQYGRLQDKVAWLGLANTTEEFFAAKVELCRQLNTGSIVPPERRAKISVALKNKPKSTEHKQKLREAALGKKASEETKLKQRLSHMGNKNSLGHIQTEEHKRKNALAQRGNHHALGKHHTLSPEIRQRMSEAAKKREAAKRPIKVYPTG